jgi:extracellular factor (EF) 3-hydroxypalmitic acid methyl ester biosynthesis protein
VDRLDRSIDIGNRFEGGGPATLEVVPPAGTAQDDPARVRTYEELEGAQGRGVFFRPHRFTAADLAPLRGTVTVARGGAPCECPLRDVSQNGVAFEWPADEPVRQDEVLRVALRFNGHQIWRGDARVTSVREQDGIVAASFENTLLDTEELLQLRHVCAWSEDGSLRASGSAWHTPGHHRFKAAVTELRLYLEDAQRKLGELEKTLPWHVMQDPSSPARTALVRRLRAEMGSDVIAYMAEIDAAMRAADPDEAAALQELSRRHVHDFVMQAPWMHRAAHKPFGYAGDYELMNFFYEKDFEGPTLFARAVGLAFLQAPVALAVKYRKDLMRRQLRAVLDRHAGGSRPVRFLSIAAGPARELQELLGEIDELPVPLEIVLFDQDKGALAHAYRRLRPLADTRFPGRVRIVFLNESIKRLLRDAHLFDEFGGFDAIYSCGLFDYLQEMTAVRLARNLSRATVPGGQVFIANMVDHASRWIMEYHLDWTLLYRTREELVAIGRRAVPDARIRLLEEETGVNPFIELVRA